MDGKRKSRIRTVASCAGFFVVLLFVLTVVTLIYYPKWWGLDAEEMRGFYVEEENTIDTLMLGSCNMYSSYSPVLAYERHGITSYVFACPDQELCTSYHYLIEALKTQDIKTVVVEALFLTNNPTSHREYYNRTALEYMPPSINKAQLIFELGSMESEYMKTVDPSASDKLLTYSSYFFPLLRYHGREDVTRQDIEFYLERDDYSKLKGGLPLYSYLANDTLDFAYVMNGDEIRDTSREYFIKIQELCEEEGIDLLLVKSPNHFRWDEAASNAVTKFAAEREVRFLDFAEYDDFLISEYSSTTGRLNVHGMKRFTEHLSDYLVDEMGVKPHDLNAEDKSKWDACVESLYEEAAEEGMSIEDGQIYRIRNEIDGIRVTWNACPGANSYSVYRQADQETFKKIGDSDEAYFFDANVTDGTMYNYYVVANNGEMKGIESNKKQYKRLDAPVSGEVINEENGLAFSWNDSQGERTYKLEYKRWDDVSFREADIAEFCNHKKSDLESGVAYDFRIRVTEECGDETYYSGGLNLKAIPLETPEIHSSSSNANKNIIEWNEIPAGEGLTVEIYRKAESESEFELLETVNIDKTNFTDDNVKKGKAYSYKIVIKADAHGIKNSSCDSNIVNIITK